MKITRFSTSNAPQRKLDLEEAVTTEIEIASSWREGTLEQTRAKADACAEFLGHLVERLYRHGALTIDDLNILLPSFTVEK